MLTKGFTLSALAVLAIVSGCTVHQTDTPGLSGPSELGLVTVLVHVAFVAFAPVFALAGCFGVAIQRRL